MPNLRLCLVLPHVLLGGGEIAMMEIAAGLRAHCDVSICALDLAASDGTPTVHGELAERFDRVAFLRRRWELRPRLRAADAVLWYGVVNSVPAALAAVGARPASIRVVHTDRAVDGPRFARRWRRVIDAVICVSPAMARRIPGAVFIPNTCSPARLQGRRQELFAAVPGRRTLGFAGRLVPQKNLSWLIENVVSLDCNLLVQALDTPWLSVSELERLVAARGLGERVRFLAAGRDVGTLLRSVDALVIASRHEGFPLAVVEAGMVGVPVISTRVGALPELFAEEILFVDSAGGVPVLASLRRALAGAVPTLGARLQARVAQLCARDAVIGRYLGLIERAVRMRPPRP